MWKCRTQATAQQLEAQAHAVAAVEAAKQHQQQQQQQMLAVDQQVSTRDITITFLTRWIGIAALTCFAMALQCRLNVLAPPGQYWHHQPSF